MRYCTSASDAEDLVQETYLRYQARISEEIVSLKASLTSLLAQDVVSWADGGGKARANLKPLYGKLAVARFWLSVTLKNERPGIFTLAKINGSPALLFWEEGQLAGVLSLTLSAGGIGEIYALVNPEKLAYLHRQLAERGITPETSQPTGFSPDQR